MNTPKLPQAEVSEMEINGALKVLYAMRRELEKPKPHMDNFVNENIEAANAELAKVRAIPPAAKPSDKTDEEAAIEHNKKVHPHLANDEYFQKPEHSFTTQAYLAGCARVRALVGDAGKWDRMAADKVGPLVSLRNELQARIQELETELKKARGDANLHLTYSMDYQKQVTKLESLIDLAVVAVNLVQGHIANFQCNSSPILDGVKKAWNVNAKLLCDLGEFQDKYIAVIKAGRAK